MMKTIYKYFIITLLLFFITYSLQCQAMAKIQYIDVVLVLDVSGSMGKPWNGETRLDILKASVKMFIEQQPVDGSIYMGVVSFSDHATTIFQLSCIGNEGVKTSIINSVYGLKAEGKTYMDDGIRAGHSMLIPGSGRKGAGKVMIIVSDGIPENKEATAQAANDAKKDGIVVVGVFIGNLSQTGDEFLRDRIAQHPEYPYFISVTNPEDLPKAFKYLAEQLYAIAEEKEVGVGREPPPIGEGAKIVGASAIVSFSLVTVSAILSNQIAFLFNALSSRILSFLRSLNLPDWLQNILQQYLEDVIKSIREEEVPPPTKWQFITIKELITIVFSMSFLFFVYYWVECGGFPYIFYLKNIFKILLPVAVTVFAVIVTDALSEALLIKVFGWWAEYSVWPQGVLSLIITGFLFSSPFASPSRVLYGVGVPSREKARFVFAKFLCQLFAASIFALLYIFGFPVIGDAGLLAILMIATFSLIPVSPLAGKILLKKSKIGWLIAFSLAFLLYFLAFTRIVPMLIFVALGFLAALTLISEIVLSTVFKFSLLRTLLFGMSS